MRTRPVISATLALLATLALGACAAEPMPTPTASKDPEGAGNTIPLDAVELVNVEIDLDTQACNALHEDCEPVKSIHVEVPVEIKGSPVTVPFRDGTLTIEYVDWLTDENKEPVDAELKLTVIANDTQDFYGSYFNGETGPDYYDSSDEPYSFYYDSDWTVHWPFREGDLLAEIEVEQWGGNGRYSDIFIDLYDITPER